MQSEGDARQRGKRDEHGRGISVEYDPRFPHPAVSSSCVCGAARRVLGVALPLIAIRTPSCRGCPFTPRRSSPRRSSESPGLRRRSRSPELEKSAKGVRFTESRKVPGDHGHSRHTASPAPGSRMGHAT